MYSVVYSGEVEYNQIKCEYGCVDGACITSGGAGGGGGGVCSADVKLCPDGVTAVGRVPPSCEFEACPEEREICSYGCFSDDRCIPIGVRTNGFYCDIDLELHEQKNGDQICENNFECKSNSCIDGQCTEPGFLTKLFEFFARLFTLG